MRKLITWLTLRTAAGELFDIDTALRPNGNSGLLVTSIASFERYQVGRGSNTAWTWEHQAITRARCAAGPAGLAAAFEATRRAVLTAERDAAALRDEVRIMREKVRAGRPVPAGRFDVKHSAGGMMDVEFAVQYLVLANGRTHAALLDNVGNIALLQRAEDAGLPAGRRRTRRGRRLPRPAPRPAHGAAGRNTDAVRPGAAGGAARRRAGAVAGGIRLSGRAAWLGVCALGVAGSLLGWFVPAPTWDWQPGRAAAEPWRAWTAAFVHWSPLHLAGNLAAAALVAVFGITARVPARTALAWALAWPLAHVGLLLQPALLHYGGLSGVLHAGVAVVLLHLLLEASGRRRLIGAMVSVGVVVKLWLEAPWGPPLRQVPGWDIAIAPLAHLTGTLAGVLAALLVMGLTRFTLAPQSRR